MNDSLLLQGQMARLETSMLRLVFLALTVNTGDAKDVFINTLVCDCMLFDILVYPGM